MGHLILSELSRFRTLVLAFGISHLVALRLLATFTDLFSPSTAKLIVGVFFYGLAGLVFGMLQIGPYRRPNQWAYLVHRPLSPRRIFAALTIAGTVILGLALALPMALATLFLDVGSAQGLDGRHWLMTPFLYGVAVAFFLCGQFVLLSRSRAAALVLCWPAFFLAPGAVGGWAFVTMALVLFWLLVVVSSAFKPNLGTHVESPVALVATALPLQYAFLGLLLISANFVYSMVVITQQAGLRGLPTFSWNDYYGEGSYPWVLTLPEKEGFAHGLAEAAGAEAKFLARQIELADVQWVAPRILRRPVRGQLMFQGDPAPLIDRERGLLWTFRHDAMVFAGIEARTGDAAGWLGASGAPGDLPTDLEPFSEVPVVAGSFVITSQELRTLDSDSGELMPRWRAPAGEKLVSWPTHEAGVTALLTDQQLYLFTPRRDDESLVARAAVPLPTSLDNFFGAHVAELVDGWGVAFLSGRRSDHGFAETRQVVGEVLLDGPWQVVAERPLRVGMSAKTRFFAFVVSPALRTFHDLAWSAAAPRRPNRVLPAELIDRRLPAGVWPAALAVALASALLAGWLGRRRELTSRARWIWTLVAFLTGLPGLLSFLFLTSRRESEAPSRRRWLPRTGALREAAS
ncbi:MAG: hypothetical protein AAF604_10850 [Acidobacteriota bacterium]